MSKTEGFLDHHAIAKALSVTPKGVEVLIAGGMPVATVGSLRCFDLKAILKWMRDNPHVPRIHSEPRRRRANPTCGHSTSRDQT